MKRRPRYWTYWEAHICDCASEKERDLRMEIMGIYQDLQHAREQLHREKDRKTINELTYIIEDLDHLVAIWENESIDRSKRFADQKRTRHARSADRAVQTERPTH